MEKCLYLVQTAEALPESYATIAGERSDLVCLTWKQPGAGDLFRPGTTWTQGRNELFHHARGLNEDYLFYIFLDDDLEFDTGGWRRFEDLLFEHRPAIGCPYLIGYPGQKVSNLELDTHLAHAFDACMNAFHRDLILDGFLVPYQTRFDGDNWWASQRILYWLANLFYPNQILQFNNIQLRNAVHGPYPRNNDFSPVDSWVLSELLRVPAAYQGRLDRIQLGQRGTLQAWDEPYERSKHYRLTDEQRTIFRDSTGMAAGPP